MSKFKKWLATILSLTMFATMSMSALAGTNSFMLGGQTLTGTTTLGSTSGGATTSFTAVAGLSVTAAYDYNYGNGLSKYEQVSASNSNSGTFVYVSASALSEHTNVDSVRVTGTHSVSYQGGSKTITSVDD